MRRRIFSIFPIILLTVLGMGGWMMWQWSHSGDSHPPHPTAAIPQRASAPRLPLHPAVAKIIVDSRDLSYLKLNYLIKELPTDLAAHDIDALLGYITARKPEKFSDGEWGSITNDIQEALSVQDVPHEKVARTLIDTYRDEARSQLMRDYALQHVGGFAIYLIHTAHTRSGTLPDFFPTLTGELIAATKDPSKPWCGTALNLLDGILRAAEYRHREIPGITPESLAALAAPVIETPTAPLNARIPALQLLSRRNPAAALPIARATLADPAAPLMLVQTSAATLAAHGSKDDLALLTSLRSQNNPHTTPALAEAIRQISQR